MLERGLRPTSLIHKAARVESNPEPANVTLRSRSLILFLVLACLSLRALALPATVTARFLPGGAGAGGCGNGGGGTRPSLLCALDLSDKSISSNALTSFTSRSSFDSLSSPMADILPKLKPKSFGIISMLLRFILRVLLSNTLVAKSSACLCALMYALLAASVATFATVSASNMFMFIFAFMGCTCTGIGSDEVIDGTRSGMAASEVLFIDLSLAIAVAAARLALDLSKALAREVEAMVAKIRFSKSLSSRPVGLDIDGDDVDEV